MPALKNTWQRLYKCYTFIEIKEGLKEWAEMAKLIGVLLRLMASRLPGLPAWGR